MLRWLDRIGQRASMSMTDHTPTPLEQIADEIHELADQICYGLCETPLPPARDAALAKKLAPIRDRLRLVLAEVSPEPAMPKVEPKRRKCSPLEPHETLPPGRRPDNPIRPN